jgi:hypothetical protein
MNNDLWTDEEVADELDCGLDDVEAIGDDLGVPKDEWTDADVDDADALLEG